MRFLIKKFQASTILGILWLDVSILEQPIQPEPLYNDAAEIESEVRTPANTQSNLYFFIWYSLLIVSVNFGQSLQSSSFLPFLPTYKHIIAHHNFLLTIATSLLSEKVNVILFNSTRKTTQTSMMII